MTRALTSQHPVTHQKEVMLLDKKGVRNGDQSHLMQPNSFYIDLLDTDYELDETFYNSNIPIILHFDTRIISWSKVSKYLDLPHVSKQAH